MLDLSNLGGPGPSSSGVTLPSTQPISGAPALPDFAAPSPEAQPQDNMIWDQLGRSLFGAVSGDAQGHHGGVLGDIPVVSDVLRTPGNVVGGLLKAGGAGIGDVIGGAANVLGHVPNDFQTAAGKMPTRIDVTTYSGTPSDAVKLILDAKHETGSVANQFSLLGQWQQAHDPQGYEQWQQALAKSQGDQGAALDLQATYVRQWGAAYADLTPQGVDGQLNGVESLLDVSPELAFTYGGSLGQSISDVLMQLGVLQRVGERGAANLQGPKSNNEGFVGSLMGDVLGQAGNQLAGRPTIGRIENLLNADPTTRTDIEQQAVDGIQQLGWTKQHALNYLLDHGQGLSHDPGAQLAAGFATDPLLVSMLGAALPEKIAARVGLYANSAESATRIGRLYNTVAKVIGTTVTDVRGSALGPAFKVARTIIDPLHALGPGAQGQAKADVFAAAGLKATEQGFGKGAVVSMFQRAARWGIKPEADNAFGVSAMNLARKWVGASHISSLLEFEDVATRRILNEDLIQALGHNSAKDAVSRMSGYVARVRKFWLSGLDRVQLADRIVKMGANATHTEVLADVARMSDDERAVWHQMTYSSAFAKFKTAVARVAPDQWGKMGSKLDNFTILNPSQLDHVAAQGLLKTLQEAKGAARAKLWNEAADRYSMIEDIGRVSPNASKQMQSRLADLERIINDGHLHTALDVREMKALPQQFKDEFVNGMLDSNGEPLWRLGFKPNAEQATGLVQGADGRLIPRFEPNIENVTDAIPHTGRVIAPLTDALGRVLPQSVTSTASKVGDALDVTMSTMTDAVSSERAMLSIEQNFRKAMRGAGYSDKVAKDVLRVSRDAVRDTSSVTLAGLSPDEFWRSAKPVLDGIVDEKVAKRDIFAMLAKSVSGDMRVLGVTGHLTQELRAAFVARGIPPNNYLGKLTVQFYNIARYTLNPLFFLQAVTDGPWFNLYRGITPVGGGLLKDGSELFEMKQIMQAMGHTSLIKDVAMDYTERFATAGWQANLQAGLTALPGVQDGIGQRLKNWVGQMILNNELAYINAGIGKTVFDSLEQTRGQLAERAAQAATPEEAALWTREMDQLPMFDFLREQVGASLGRVATDEEVGRAYLSEMIADSRLEVRTPEGLLDYSRVNSKAAYHVPSTVGELRPLNLAYLADALHWPNVKTVADLRQAISQSGTRTVAELRDDMKALGMHPDAINRAARSLTFNWRTYFDGLRHDLGMSSFEMQGIEDMVSRSARIADMSPVDYITQVMPLAARSAAGLDGDMKFVLDVMRAAKQGEAGSEKLAQLVVGHLQPSMKLRLLDHFASRIAGSTGLIEQAMAAGRVEEAQGLNRVLEDLAGGWGPVADDQFHELVIRRAAGEVIKDPEVERAARYFSKWMQEVGPSIQAGEVLKDIVSRIPVEGASAHDFTQALLMDTLASNVRLAEKDAIRLSHMGTERTVLDRSLNHPFFAMYPTSYMWGKVIPETFRFIAREPFGIKTGAGALAYAKTQQTVLLQQQYDDQMAALWKKFGKSAVVGLLSYITPSMPWEDMRGNLPPWVRSLGKNGVDISKMTQAEFDTLSPERWYKRIFQAGGELAPALGDLGQGVSQSVLPPALQQGLTNISQTAPSGAPPKAPVGNLGPTSATDLAPVLADEMTQLQQVLRGTP